MYIRSLGLDSDSSNVNLQRCNADITKSGRALRIQVSNPGNKGSSHGEI